MIDITVRETTEEEFNNWMEISKKKIIDDYMYIDDLTYEESYNKVMKQYVELLPDGYNSNNQYFFSLDYLEHKNIGFSWFGVYDTLPEKAIFLADIMIDESFRSKGLGRKFLEYTQKILFEKGFVEIYLHVTKRNYAKDLYKSLGYKVVQEGKMNYIMVLKKE